MAEFQKVLKEKERICDRYVCDLCPLGKSHKLQSEYCSRWVVAYPKQAESIIMKWAQENPLVTNRMKFREVFGFEFTDRVPESQYHREWLDAEYERKE